MLSSPDILTAYNAILAALDEQDGEITPDIEARLAALGEQAADRIAALRAVVLRLDAEAALCGDEAARLRQRGESCTRAAGRVKALATTILEAQEAAGMEPRVRSAQITAWLHPSNPSLAAPEDPAEWPADLVEQRPHLLRADAIKALQGGREIRGFALLHARHLRWR